MRKERDLTVNIKVNDKTQILTNPKKLRDDISNLENVFNQLPIIDSKVLADSIKNFNAYTDQVKASCTNTDKFIRKVLPDISELNNTLEYSIEEKKEGKEKRLYEADKKMKALGDVDGLVNLVLNAAAREAGVLKAAIVEPFKGIGKGTPTIPSSMTGQMYYSEDKRKEGDEEYIKKMEEYIASLDGVHRELTQAVFDAQKNISDLKADARSEFFEHQDNYANARSEFTFWIKNIMTNSGWQKESENAYMEGVQKIADVYGTDIEQGLADLKKILADIEENTSDPALNALVKDLQYKFEVESKDASKLEYFDTVLRKYTKTLLKGGYEMLLDIAVKNSELMGSTLIDNASKFHDVVSEVNDFSKNKQYQEAPALSPVQELPIFYFDKERGGTRIGGQFRDINNTPKKKDNSPENFKEDLKNNYDNLLNDSIQNEQLFQQQMEELGNAEAERKLRQQREQSNLELNEQEFFQQKSLLSTESFNDRKDELLSEAQQSMAAFANATQSTNEAILESTDNTAVSFEDKWKGIHETLQKHVDAIMTGVNAIFSGMNSILSNELEEAKEKYDAITEKYDEVVEQREESSSRLNELEEQAKNARGGRSLILQEQIDHEMAKNKQLAQQESQLAKEKEKSEKEVAKKEKQTKKSEISQQIIQGVSNTALGVTKAWSLGPIIGPIMAALVGAAGAIQVAVMSKQLAKLEDGGLLNGKRHSQGGMRIEGTNIEVEGGEYVVNRESTSKNLGLVRYINSQRRELKPNDLNGFFSKPWQSYEPPFRKHFEAGGELPAITSPSTLNNEMLVDAIKAIKIEPKVAVTDILRVQDEMTQVDGWSGI
ncbi:ElaB/YqjD/DUF883 family membrane-anchored ribosome-binding protein [Dysgonomonas sp. PFB1-18]|uniref:hypothetical protein n=1 Tax=unclassified Dysgonomonas TaxID=2630389 RepID=UPI002475792F|nr:MULTISPECIES: hypothetical protein [unclassified Dysgonomonas]MDH6309338.1 ElaB/YqjD/DUF883 family membrane-anchored ribosome-binding protein [Dysgonomonas sp. PF1-14]MDH6339797.1 ElaB/YqjD/DUF883 family membrane-anchored ribosome-binding protein [Dysgonomonas sp. PF1-16]MDH6381445.1 ElaB/YqjD/DUF883 family membrane-anchored ribosome-binding protein [Dysgonomonas sp. PFB1-18]MDH6398660.1 ElaB/YqjD/DUF883 family membrane-anchored ribosome-binding protein [Dysgonomonas sp. PF1-23]